MRRRSWYTRAPRGQERKRSPLLLIGGGLTVCLLAIVAVVVATGGGGSATSGRPSEDPSGQADSQGEGSSDTTASPTEGASTSGGLPSAPIEGTGLVSVEIGTPFVWPAQGSLVAGIGPSRPGIEIGLTDSTIMAAARGTVASIGPALQGPPGFEIVIDHGNGLQTSYGLIERAVVSQGDAVRQGELIGLGAAAGGPASLLHFEVTIRGSQIDPLDVLPAPGVNGPDTFSVDCASEVIVIDSGAPLILDFGEELDQGAIVARASVLIQDGSAELDVPQAQASVADSARVLVETLPSVVDSGGTAYTLVVETRGGGQRERFNCTLGVRTRTVEPSPFFLPPTPSPNPAPPEPTPQPAPGTVPAVLPTEMPDLRPTSTPILTPPTPTKTPFAGG